MAKGIPTEGIVEVKKVKDGWDVVLYAPDGRCWTIRSFTVAGPAHRLATGMRSGIVAWIEAAGGKVLACA